MLKCVRECNSLAVIFLFSRAGALALTCMRECDCPTVMLLIPVVVVLVLNCYCLYPHI